MFFTASLSLIALAALWISRDYAAWIAFGTGGTPANWSGYLKITKFRLLRIWAGDDLRDPSMLSSQGPSYLGDLPKRNDRPRIMSRTLPQRQYPEPLDQTTTDYLHSLPKKYATGNLYLDKSITEGRTTDALYVKPEYHIGHKDSTLGDEIAHVHPAENSLHVWLTEADAKKVVSAGWGERFPLASLKMVDVGWTFVYAPRSMEEALVIEEIIKAGIGHLAGK
ncbi:hypothetical protein AMS68_005199 [Peltaster fructicola]|uniref:Luciferase domain-containing protein n=1 Tax=Peltaster fructicola TaxID=286661 RepID=A0A6H0XY36_9PEZI|nr:hypothetical protein AMS68_005199 [Peltaster fructicola]